MGYLRIGELSKRTETNNETLRFYETKGLIDAPRRSEAGYRLYTADAVERVNFIVRAKRMGFSLKEVTELLSLQVEESDSTSKENIVPLRGGMDKLLQLKTYEYDFVDEADQPDRKKSYRVVESGTQTTSGCRQ
mgnify:CR=1 FL=1